MQATHSDQHATADTPFEQVRVAEDREHARVEEAKKKYEAATLEKLRAIDSEKSEKAEAQREAKSQELKEFASKETTTIISGAQKDAEKDVAMLDAHASKHLKHAEDDLLKKALDPSFTLNA